jgi:hypothetical protein
VDQLVAVLALVGAHHVARHRRTRSLNGPEAGGHAAHGDIAVGDDAEHLAAAAPGSTPMSSWRISAAARLRLSSGVTTCGLGDMISLIRLMMVSCAVKRGHP